MSRSPSARRSSRAPQRRKAAPAVGQSDDTSPQVAPTAKSDGPTAAEPTEAQREPDSQPTREPSVDAGVPAANKQRFRIFIIDSGWHSAAQKVLRENLALLDELTQQEAIYVLDHNASVDLLRRHRHLIGRDPIIVVHDVHALRTRGVTGPHGFRLHLGLVREEDRVLHALQAFARFVSTYRANRNIEDEVRERLHREGFAGAIEIIMGGHPNEIVTR